MESFNWAYWVFIQAHTSNCHLIRLPNELTWKIYKDSVRLIPGLGPIQNKEINYENCYPDFLLFTSIRLFEASKIE